MILNLTMPLEYSIPGVTRLACGYRRHTFSSLFTHLRSQLEWFTWPLLFSWYSAFIYAPDHAFQYSLRLS
jgi:hypothetical protein